MSAPAAGRAWAAIAAATVLNLPFGSLYAFSVFLKPMEQTLALSRAELSFVFGLASVAFTAGMNAAPYLYGVASAARLVLLCVVGDTVGIALSATAGGLVQLAIGYGILFGVSGGIAYIVVLQGLNLMMRSRQGLVNGYVVSLLPAGAMIAAPLFGWAIEGFGLRATLGGLAVAFGVTGLAAMALVAWSGMTLQAAAAAPSLGPGERRRLVFWQLWLVFFLAAAAGLTVLSQAAGMVAAYGGSTGFALFATTGITGCIAAARLGGGWLVDFFAVPTVMAGAHAFALAGSVLLTLWPGPIMAMAALAMIGMGYGFISGSTAAAVASYWHVNAFGRVASRLYIAWCVAAITLPVLAGRLFDLTGGYETAIVIAACGNLAGAGVALTLPRRAGKAAAVALS